MSLLIGEITVSDALDATNKYATMLTQTVVRNLGGYGHKGTVKIPPFPERPK